MSLCYFLNKEYYTKEINITLTDNGTSFSVQHVFYVYNSVDNQNMDYDQFVNVWRQFKEQSLLQITSTKLFEKCWFIKINMFLN